MSRLRRTRPAALLLALLATNAACASQAQPSASGVSAATSGGEQVEVALPPSAASYDTRPAPGAAITGDSNGSIGHAVEEAARAHGQHVAPDARLAQLAAWVAEHSTAAGVLPSAAAMDLASRQLGLIEPLPTLSVIASGEPIGMDGRVGEEAGNFFAHHDYSFYGGVVRNELGGQRCVVVFAQRFVELAPIPRSVEPGAALAIEGNLASGYSSAALAVTAPDGHVDRGEVTRGAGVRFRAATREPGVYRVEILAESKLGTTVIANFPVYVGVAVPERVTITTASARDDEASDEVRVQHVLDLVNGERARAGVSPLVLDRALSSVALAHDADMIANGFIGHTSPTTGTAAERVARAGIRTDLVLENIGRGYSLQEVHDGLLASPGHRANLVNPQATNVGIGVATERDHERTAYVVTEVFTRVSKKLDENAAHALLDAVNRTRAARGLTELRGDAALDAIAMRTARGYFTAPTSSDAQVMAHAQAELSKPSARPRRIGAVLTVVGSVDDLVTLEALANPAAKSVGIGLAQGTRPGGLPNAICAVLLIAE